MICKYKPTIFPLGFLSCSSQLLPIFSDESTQRMRMASRFQWLQSLPLVISPALWKSAAWMRQKTKIVENMTVILKMSQFTDTNRTSRPPPQPPEDAVRERKSTGSSQVAFLSSLHGHAAAIIPSDDDAQLSKNSANTTGTDRCQRTREKQTQCCTS